MAEFYSSRLGFALSQAREITEALQDVSRWNGITAKMQYPLTVLTFYAISFAVLKKEGERYIS